MFDIFLFSWFILIIDLFFLKKEAFFHFLGIQRFSIYMNGCRRLLPLSSSNSTSPSPSSPPYNTASRCSQRPQTDRASTGKHLCCMTCLLSIPEVLK